MVEYLLPVASLSNPLLRSIKDDNVSAGLTSGCAGAEDPEHGGELASPPPLEDPLAVPTPEDDAEPASTPLLGRSETGDELDCGTSAPPASSGKGVNFCFFGFCKTPRARSECRSMFLWMVVRASLDGA